MSSSKNLKDNEYAALEVLIQLSGLNKEGRCYKTLKTSLDELQHLRGKKDKIAIILGGTGK